MVIYTCDCCNFSSNLISNYNRHLNTKKHKKRIQNNDNLRNDDFDILKKDHKKTIFVKTVIKGLNIKHIYIGTLNLIVK